MLITSELGVQRDFLSFEVHQTELSSEELGKNTPHTIKYTPIYRVIYVFHLLSHQDDYDEITVTCHSLNAIMAEKIARFQLIL